MAGVGQEAAGGETLHFLGRAFLQGPSVLGRLGEPKNVGYPNNLENIGK